MNETIKKSRLIERGGQVEMVVGDDVKKSRFFNPDLAPTRLSERTWNTWHVAALWVSLSICVPTYTLGGVLTTYFGLSMMQAVAAIVVANLIILIPLTLNAVAGTRYGIPFPIFLRSSFGLTGSNIPALIRALTACGWFGIQTMFGGMALSRLVGVIVPSWHLLGASGDVIGFFVFGAMNLYVVIKGSESIKLLETLAAPILAVVCLALLWWGLSEVPLSHLLHQTSLGNEHTTPHFFAGVTAMVGYWATLSLNIPDFSRFVKNQQAQIWGQIIGLPTTMFMMAMLGVVMTEASAQLIGHTVADPVSLIGAIGNPLFVAIAMVLIVLATLSTNAAANVVSPTNDLQNMAPRWITRTRAVLITGLVGLLLMAHELLKQLGWIHSDLSIESLLSNWLLSYSSLLGPIAGIMVADYFIIEQQQLDLIGLYREDVYPRWNICGIIAFILPIIATGFSMFSPTVHWFYDYGWFTGSISGGIIYVIAWKIKAALQPGRQVVG
ncbi:putative allantoin permease [Halomonadaceae bacterium LMG 33818]|uniref:NCS1 family nucleobase:cation symporter-1 n=1 Tax=Cernens ardua TaxID=3402176 RepID=UPI003EDBD0A1